jgi:hypothetical protein
MQENPPSLKTAWKCELCYCHASCFPYLLLSFPFFFYFSLLSSALTQSILLFIIGPQVGKDVILSRFYHFFLHFLAARLLVSPATVILDGFARVHLFVQLPWILD